MRYEDSIRQIKGVGEKAEQRFHKLDIWNVGDLLEHYPREYDEFHDLVKIADVKEGEMAAVEGVMACRPSIHTTARLKILSMVLEDETGRITVTWFNMPFLANRLKMGTRYILRGKVGRKNGKLVLVRQFMTSISPKISWNIERPENGLYLMSSFYIRQPYRQSASKIISRVLML